MFDHIETVRQFFQETTTGQDPALRTFAQEQLPTLVQHLDSAVALDLAGRGLPPTSATVNAAISSLAPDLRGIAAVGAAPETAQVMAISSMHS